MQKVPLTCNIYELLPPLIWLLLSLKRKLFDCHTDNSKSNNFIHEKIQEIHNKAMQEVNFVVKKSGKHLAYFGVYKISEKISYKQKMKKDRFCEKKII